jgi:hypothetical protein
MREVYDKIDLKIKELEIRASMPLILGIFMLQSIKKQLKNTNRSILNEKSSSLLGYMTS